MTPTPAPTPRAGQPIRVPVLWGLAFGAIQAASPLALWWLDQATGYLWHTLIACAPGGPGCRRSLCPARLAARRFPDLGGQHLDRLAGSS